MTKNGEKSNTNYGGYSNNSLSTNNIKKDLGKLSNSSQSKTSTISKDDSGGLADLA